MVIRKFLLSCLLASSAVVGIVVIKYLGSKRLLLDHITSAVDSLIPKGTVLDLFSGTSRVGMALKRKGYKVHANDYAAFAYTVARCYIKATTKMLPSVGEWVDALNSLEPRSEEHTSELQSH